MIIPYNEDKLSKPNIIGYISYSGNIIDYSVLNGRYGHTNENNIASQTFIKYMGYLYGRKTKDVIHHFSDFTDFNKITDNSVGASKMRKEVVKDLIRVKEALVASKKSGEINPFLKMQYELLQLFDNCYRADNFFEALGKLITVEEEEIIIDRYQKKHNLIYMDYKDRKSIYSNYLCQELLSYIKDIYVRYLGYDSIERKIVVPGNERGAARTLPQQVIQTTYRNIYERFYNYILMDWSIERVPAMIWCEKEKAFREDGTSSLLQITDKEMILEEEIMAIKRLKLVKERTQYFR